MRKRACKRESQRVLPSCSPPGTTCLLPSLHVSFELHHVGAHENGAQLGASLIESTQVRTRKTCECELRISDLPFVSLKPAPLGSGPCSPQGPSPSEDTAEPRPVGHSHLYSFPGTLHYLSLPPRLRGPEQFVSHLQTPKSSRKLGSPGKQHSRASAPICCRTFRSVRVSEALLHSSVILLTSKLPSPGSKWRLLA